MQKASPNDVGKLRSLWIILTSFWFMADTCGRAILKSLFGTISRQWCNQELQRWSKRMIKLLKIHCTIINPYNVQPQPGRATILMCNHASLFDIPISLQAFPSVSLRMLAKKELSRIPIMGGGMVAAEFPFIDRKNRRQAMHDLDTVNTLLKSGIVIWIAPEGTRSCTGALAPFKKGGFITAIKTHASIIPMAIRGADQILPARTRRFRLHQQAEVHIGKPIDASKYELDNKDALILEVHHAIQTLLTEA